LRANSKLIAALMTALLAAAVPSATLATVVINIERATLTAAPGDSVMYLTAFVTDIDNSNERLNAYTVVIDAPGFTPDGVRFVIPGSDFGLAGRPAAPHPYVFKDFETVPPIENFSSTYNRLQFGATAVAPEDEVDVGVGLDGLIRIGVFIPANWHPSSYPSALPLVVDPRVTTFWGLDGPVIALPGQEGGIFILPEPSASALLLVPSLALRRRPRRTA
jgi:hypothetical protein